MLYTLGVDDDVVVMLRCYYLASPNGRGIDSARERERRSRKGSRNQGGEERARARRIIDRDLCYTSSISKFEENSSLNFEMKFQTWKRRNSIDPPPIVTRRRRK